MPVSSSGPAPRCTLRSAARLSIFAAAFLATALLRCGDDDEPKDPSLPEGVIYEGEASDEALKALYPKLEKAEVDAQLALITPTGAVSASADPAPAFTWVGEASLLPRLRPEDRWRLPSLLPVAHAHLPPFTGMSYLLEIHGAGVVYVYTDAASWQPRSDEWSKITGGKAGRVTVKIYRAYLEENVVTEGPFVTAEDASFQVTVP